MNAIAQTILASQNLEAAKKAAEAAKIEMQKEIFADARLRVSKLVKDFNTTPMELQRVQNGPPGSFEYPLYSSYGVGREYTRLGNGLRFFLLWGPNNRTLYLALNIVCRYAYRVATVRNLIGDEVGKLTQSTELLTLAQAEEAIMSSDMIDDKNYRAMCHITLDGRFARGEVSYDERNAIDNIFKTPVDCMTAIVGGHDIARFAVIKPKKGKKS